MNRDQKELKYILLDYLESNQFEYFKNEMTTFKNKMWYNEIIEVVDDLRDWGHINDKNINEILELFLSA